MVKFSVIITAHDEEKRAEMMMRSIWRALAKIEEKFEVIVNIDRGTPETIKLFRELAKERDLKILESGYGDVGPARNATVKVARGEYVFFIDADDLVSENYFTEAMKTLEKSTKEVVVSPEWCIDFEEDGKEAAILRMQNSESREHDAYMLFSVNLWIMAIAGRRETFLKHQYMRSESGYGHEDYALNIALADAGIQHKVAPGAVYFYRRKRVSRRTEHNQKKLTQPRSDLFAIKYWRSFDKKTQEKIQARAKSFMARLKLMYKTIRRNRLFGKILNPVMMHMRSLMSKQLIDEIPSEVMQEWDEIAAIEPKARRNSKRLNAMGYVGVNSYCPASEAYLEICKNITTEPTYVLVVPYLDKKTRQILEDELMAGEIVMLVVTDTVKISNVPEGVEVIEFGKIAKNLDAEQCDLLMTRLLVQYQVRTGLSSVGYGAKWLKRHEELTTVTGTV